MGAPRTLRSLFPILLVGLAIVLLTTFLAGHTAHGPQAPKRAAGTSASTSSVSAKVAKVKTKAVAAVLPPAKRGRAAWPAVKVLDPTTHAWLPKDGFLPGYKSPCYKGTLNDSASQEVKCLPYGMVLGSFQSGAQSLFLALYNHPHVLKTDVSRWHFWAEDAKRFDGYVTGLRSASKKIAAAPDKPLITLDGSASTFAFYWSADMRVHQGFQRSIVACWKECADSNKGNEKARHACMDAKCYQQSRDADKQMAVQAGISYDDMHLPLLLSAAYGARPPKMIVLLRDPVERLHSAYWFYGHYNKKYGESPEGFLKYVKEQVGAFRACESRGGARGCAFAFETWSSTEEQVFFHADQFFRGMYSLYMEGWLRYFPRDTFLILRAEDYFRDSEGIVQRAMVFLDLDSDVTRAGPEGKNAHALMMREVNGPEYTHNKGPKPQMKKGRPVMLPEARKILVDLYRPYNERLVELLGDPKITAGWAA